LRAKEETTEIVEDMGRVRKKEVHSMLVLFCQVYFKTNWLRTPVESTYIIVRFSQIFFIWSSVLSVSQKGKTG
jgi:hypothetical protein